ncbi:MAG: hypothetical protein HXX80_00655, partial [Nitrososphaerales archaeon]|nr:hypothetical protein [Nitrososphaerales archaeon]
MHKSSYAILSLLLALLVVSTSIPYGSSQANGVTVLWISPMSVNDIAVSKDSNYIAAVNNDGVYFFAYNDPNPLWWYP